MKSKGLEMILYGGLLLLAHPCLGWGVWLIILSVTFSSTVNILSDMFLFLIPPNEFVWYVDPTSMLKKWTWYDLDNNKWERFHVFCFVQIMRIEGYGNSSPTLLSFFLPFCYIVLCSLLDDPVNDLTRSSPSNPWVQSNGLTGHFC